MSDWQVPAAAMKSGWLSIKTAPKDGTPFIAKDGYCIMAAFYKKNTSYKAKQPVTLQVFTRPPASYSSASNWFKPTHWMPEPPP